MHIEMISRVPNVDFPEWNEDRIEEQGRQLFRSDFTADAQFLVLAVSSGVSRLLRFLAIPSWSNGTLLCWCFADPQEAELQRQLTSTLCEYVDIGCWVLRRSDEQSIRLAAE